jgi:hypothetical protein
MMIEVNGHKGRFYFDPKISYYPGDDRIDSPIYGGDTLEIDLPARFVKARETKLVLTAVEDADNPESSIEFLRSTPLNPVLVMCIMANAGVIRTPSVLRPWRPETDQEIWTEFSVITVAD